MALPALLRALAVNAERMAAAEVAAPVRQARLAIRLAIAMEIAVHITRNGV